MKKIWRRGIPFSPEVAALVSHMPAVDEYRESLVRLQGVWDSLSMLGQMSGTLPDIDATRSAFQALTEQLLDSLGRCLLGNLVEQMHGQGQVAIDILVRNLFERTADIGFLSSDSVLCDFVQASARGETTDAQRLQLESRFAEYVAKYSVYDDVVVLTPEGRVLARLDSTTQAVPGVERWLPQALAGKPYVEHFGPSPVMGGRRALLYGAGIRVQQQMLGVLCLSFRIDDELQGVFRQLVEPGDPAVAAIVDAEGLVLASSDRWQLPAGATLPPPAANASGLNAALDGKAGPSRHRQLRFAGRDYLAINAQATGYEGYHGPGWSACVMVPTDHAFQDGQDEGGDDLLGRIDTRGFFDEELRSIPDEARRIQRDLSRVLWNGKLQSADGGPAPGFTATLLREVGLTGDRIREVFDQATGQLQRSALAAVFQQARHHARLAIDIMDRNLYERANDCRWWALDGVLRQTLATPAELRDSAAASAVLRRINGLYTVYALLVLFDAEGRVVAVSDPAQAAWEGRQLDAPWVAQTLALREPQAYTRSTHGDSALYGERATYVFGAAVHEPGAIGAGSKVLGGIGIVFDGAPQFEAMLRHATPAVTDAAQAHAPAALLVTRSGRVVSSNDARWPIGGPAPMPATLALLPRGCAETSVLELEGVAYVSGYAMAGGYREYGQGRSHAPDDVAALMLIRLGEISAAAPAGAAASGTRGDTPRLAASPAGSAASSGNAPGRPANGAARLSIASFHCDGQWLGLPASATLQALQRPRIAPIPNAPAQLLGMVLFENKLLPVIDIASLRTGRPTTDIDAPVVVVQAAQGQRFALRVDELGPVFDAAPEELQPLGATMRHGSGEQVLRSQRQMLVLLDLAQLLEVSGARVGA